MSWCEDSPARLWLQGRTENLGPWWHVAQTPGVTATACSCVHYQHHLGQLGLCRLMPWSWGFPNHTVEVLKANWMASGPRRSCPQLCCCAWNHTQDLCVFKDVRQEACYWRVERCPGNSVKFLLSIRTSCVVICPFCGVTGRWETSVCSSSSSRRKRAWFQWC